jgi:small-conductance mechanosensitive channel
MSHAVLSIINFILLIIYIIFLIIFLDQLLSYFLHLKWLQNLFFIQPAEKAKKLMTNFIEYIPKLVFIIICIYLAKLAMFINDKVFDAIDKKEIKTSEFYYDFREFFRRSVRFIIYFFTIIIIFPNLPGYDLPVFKGLSIVAAVMVSIGSGSILNNLLSGVILIIGRTYKVGDRVQIGDNVGQIVEMTLYFTRLRTDEKRDIVIPSMLVFQKGIINLSNPVREIGGTIIDTTITIGYQIPGRIIRELCIKAAESTKDILSQPEVEVIQKSLDNFYVTYTVHAYTDKPNDYLFILTNLNNNIRRIFDEAGVEIMSPSYTAFRNGNASTIPKKP